MTSRDGTFTATFTIPDPSVSYVPFVEVNAGDRITLAQPLSAEQEQSESEEEVVSQPE